MAKVNLSAPWVTFYHEIEALFGSDPEIKIIYDESENDIRLYVDNAGKAAALSELLPAERKYGNVTIKVTVIPSNELAASPVSAYETAFENNPVFAYAKTVPGTIYAMPASYVVFKNRVVQYFNDDLSDVNGNCSTLYQEIAKDVFGTDAGVFFCTDTEEKVTKGSVWF